MHACLDLRTTFQFQASHGCTSRHATARTAVGGQSRQAGLEGRTGAERALLTGSTAPVFRTFSRVLSSSSNFMVMRCRRLPCKNVKNSGERLCSQAGGGAAVRPHP